MHTQPSHLIRNKWLRQLSSPFIVGRLTPHDLQGPTAAALTLQKAEGVCRVTYSYIIWLNITNLVTGTSYRLRPGHTVLLWGETITGCTGTMYQALCSAGDDGGCRLWFHTVLTMHVLAAPILKLQKPGVVLQITRPLPLPPCHMSL